MIRTRFAPSPTGFLHVGGVRTALFSWAFARAQGGECLLRIEDTDQERSRPEAIEAIIEGLRWLKLDFDGPISYQTKRLSRYQEVIQELLAQGHAYRCYMSADELDQLRETQRSRGDKPRYDNRWRPEHQAAWGLTPPTDPNAHPHVIRFRTPQEGSISFTDLVKGPITVENQELDDFIIMRTDGTPTYNFCVVVDDWDMGITHVIRGDDHVNNTPRQCHVFKALGATPPAYGHLPMIAGPDGQKLSKRHGAVSVLAYETEGFLPTALLNYLARLGWASGDQEVFDQATFVSLFSLSDVQNAPARFDTTKLSWLNQEHIKACSLEELDQYLQRFLQRYADTALDRGYAEKPEEQRLAWLALYQSRVQTLRMLMEEAQPFFLAYRADNLTPPERPGLLLALVDIQNQLAEIPWERDKIAQMIKQIAKTHQLTLQPIGQHLRQLLLGKIHAPSFPDIIYLLGREETLARLTYKPA